MLPAAALAALWTPLLAGQLGDVTQGAQVDDPALVRLGAHHPYRRGLKLDGFGLLVGRGPVDPGSGGSVAGSSAPSIDMMLLQANALLTEGTWSLNASLRLRLDEVVPPSWNKTAVLFQEAYAGWRLDDRLQLKVGKVYQQFGRTWDYTFSGPLAFSTDLKLRPHIGASAEGCLPLNEQLGLVYAAQYFIVDGESFSALGHDAGLRNVRQRNALVLRAAPRLEVNDHIAVQVGGTAKSNQSVSQPAPAGSDQGPDRLGVDGVVRTAALDVDVEAYNAGIFVEAGRQFGDNSSIQGDQVALRQDGITPGFTYVWTGAKYGIGPTTLRLSYNEYFYVDGTHDTLWTPGVTFKLNDNFQLLGEFNIWRTRQPDGRPQKEREIRLRDRSLYVVLSATI